MLEANAKESGAADSKACFRVLRGHEGRVCCLKFDEDKIVSGSDDSTVKVRKKGAPFSLAAGTASPAD